MKVNQKNKHRGFIAGITIFAVAFCVFIDLGLKAWRIGDKALGNSQDLSNLGNYGSYLQGTTGTLWAVAGTFLTIIAILASLWQLSLQREQLAAQDEQLDQQLKTLKTQNFENSFFQLLNLQNSILVRTKKFIRGGGHGEAKYVQKELRGTECFEEFYKRLKHAYNEGMLLAKAVEGLPTSKTLGGRSESETVLLAYEQIYEGPTNELFHYFGNLYHVIKFVKQSDITERRKYTSIVRAQLSPFELLVLFYNGVSPHGVKFRPLIEEFGLLEHLDRDLLLDKSHADWYAASAFG